MLFIIEIFMTINQVYRDDNLKLHVKYSEICKNYLSTWFLLDILAIFFTIWGLSISSMNTGLTDPKTGYRIYVYNQNSRYFKLAVLLRLLKLFSVHRIKRIAGSISGDPRKPNIIVFRLLQLFAVVVWILAIVLSIFVVMNAK